MTPNALFSGFANQARPRFLFFASAESRRHLARRRSTSSIPTLDAIALAISRVLQDVDTRIRSLHANAGDRAEREDGRMVHPRLPSCLPWGH